MTREGHRRGHGLRVASIQGRECPQTDVKNAKVRVKELPGRGGEIRVSNLTERDREIRRREREFRREKERERERDS